MDLLLFNTLTLFNTDITVLNTDMASLYVLFLILWNFAISSKSSLQQDGAT